MTNNQSQQTQPQQESYQSLQDIKQCVQSITQQLLWLKGTTPSNQAIEFVDEAILRIDKAMRFAKRAYSKHDSKSQFEDVEQQQQQQTQQGYKAQRPSVLQS